EFVVQPFRELDRVRRIEINDTEAQHIVPELPVRTDRPLDVASSSLLRRFRFDPGFPLPEAADILRNRRGPQTGTRETATIASCHPGAAEIEGPRPSPRIAVMPDEERRPIDQNASNSTPTLPEAAQTEVTRFLQPGEPIRAGADADMVLPGLFGTSWL